MEEQGEHASLLIKVQGDATASCHGDGEATQALLQADPGSPPLKSKGSGGGRAVSLILGLECLESMAFNGIATNLVVYIRSVLHAGTASSASIVSLWYGTSYFLPIIGATIADAYLGNYKTTLISFVMYLLGMVLITVATFLLSNSVLCNTSSCPSSSGTQTVIFFAGLYLTAVGCGGVRSALLPFGAEQLNKENTPTSEIKSRRNFFNAFYVCVIFGVITSGTIIVWVQENVSWALGYGAATACIGLALVGFLAGTPMYQQNEPRGSPLKTIFQVIVASFRNMGLEVPSDSSLLYEVRSNHIQRTKLAHSDDFRFLDKAAVISDPSLAYGDCQSSWSLCTVTEVEELKILIRLLPIWVTGVFFAATISQMHTTFIQQGTVMNTEIGSLSIPPASLYSFEVICVTLWVLLVDKLIVPATRTCFANGAEPTQLQRIGIGRFLMIFAMVMAALLEAKRLQSVQEGELLSVVWQLPQYFVIAGAEFLAVIGQMEFFYSQAPDSMKSIVTAFALLTSALGNYLSSAIISLIAGVTRGWHSPGWIPDDLNKGHLDYYFWCLTALSLANFVVYLYFASKYKFKKAIIF